MHDSTKYLLTQLYLEKLTRLKFPINQKLLQISDPKNPLYFAEQDWTKFENQLKVAEKTFKQSFFIDKENVFKKHSLITQCIPFWELAVSNGEVFY